ncbi:MAG: hypothetical protein ACRECX_09915 [Methyloceanibacter sp.]|uniref:hypothetical protein n=1 Tax=Methyloceanibacter sp. TaxID=1965321 RepID=UPI003D6D6671
MKVRKLTRIALAAVLLAALSSQCAAAETLLWTQKTSGGFVTLTYGALDPAKHPLFMLSCINGMGIAVLDVRLDLPETEPGTPLTIELSSGGLTALVESEAASDEASGGTFAQTSEVRMKPVLDVLRGTEPVSVEVGAAKATLSDHNRTESVEKFSKDCELG